MAESLFLSKKILKVLWTTFCIIITTVVALLQIKLYLEDKDVTNISYKIFNENEQDVYPSIGFCFPNVVIEEKLKPYGFTDPTGSNWSFLSLGEYYNAVLAGMHSNQDILLAIDYDEVTKKTGDYLLAYEVSTGLDRIEIYNSDTSRSLTETTGMCRNENLRPKIPCFRELSMSTLKCVSIDIPFIKHKKIVEAYITFKADIFKGGVRPKYGSFFFAPHYPKQLFRNFYQGQHRWPDRAKNKSKTYITRFSIRNVEVAQQRNKYKEPCTTGLPDNDQQSFNG